MKQPVVIDLRNIYRPEDMAATALSTRASAARRWWELASASYPSGRISSTSRSCVIER